MKNYYTILILIFIIINKTAYLQPISLQDKMDYCTEKIKKDSTADFYYKIRGDIWLELEEYESAREDYNDAIKINAQYSEAFRSRGLLEYNIGNYMQSIKDFTSSIQIEVKATTYFNRACAYDEINNFDEAIKDYMMAIKLDSSIYQSYNNLGLIYFEKKDYEKAIQLYNKAIFYNKETPELYYNRAYAKSYLDKFDDAISDIDVALNIAPNNPHIYYYLGFIYKNKDDLAKACESWKEAKKLGLTIKEELTNNCK